MMLPLNQERVGSVSARGGRAQARREVANARFMRRPARHANDHRKQSFEEANSMFERKIVVLGLSLSGHPRVDHALDIEMGR